ncbi:membrane protein FxsA [Mesobacillus subterraneus]|uniref:FxsA family protein n=1 Tax=Mesobacillus subterraneus TaxID=285983 RepID=UPI00203B2959|nr:FxsA family protein [Mesobacillus subterraneus]MCM3663722.1 membrane protein FxsA [Mesobacillus subterraneus]MCM3683485.1 membrane protein FxsA [Mesobacillus subterraneus]
MKYIFLFLVLVPAAEIGILLYAGQTFGVWTTILLIILTGFLGAYLAKQQGLEIIRKTQEQLRRGEMPGDAILDGVSILVGGTLLLTPGFVTDTLGFLLLAPPTRKFFKVIMMKAFRNWINKGNIKVIR